MRALFSIRVDDSVARLLPLAVFAVLVGAVPAWSHGGTFRPPPPPQQPPDPPKPPPPPMQGPPTGSVPPGLRTPSDPKPERPTPPPTTGPTHDTPTSTPPPAGIGPKPDPGEQPGRPGTRTRRTSAGADQGWRIWWEFNRTHLVGLRHLLHGRGPITGKKAPPGPPDPLGGYRPSVLSTMRSLAGGTGERLVRASCILALGRIGGDEDARLFLGLLADARQPSDVHEAAALALGMLPPLRADATRAAVRRAYERLFAGELRLPARARELALVGCGLRARDDRALVMMLAARTVGGVESSAEGAALALACGLAGDRMLYPELREAALRRRIGGHVLNDVGRSHVVLALGLLGEPAAASDFLRIVHSRRSGLHTRRSAVLALGRLLQDEALPADQRRRAAKALVPLFTKNGDVVLRGFAMLAAGGARPPIGTGELMNAVDRGGNAELKPYAGLALGLAARDRDDKAARRIHAFLAEELDKTNQLELQSALCIAVGLAGARRAEKALLGLVQESGAPAVARGAAAQGLGLFRSAPDPVQEAILDAMKNGPRDLVGDAALALGMLGRRTTAPLLVEQLARSDSGLQQGRLMLALGHLGHGRATEPLLRLLENTTVRSTVREFAAVALGLMGDARETDTLFALDAGFNYFATTTTTNELIRLY